jgi:hypothetical protein
MKGTSLGPSDLESPQESAPGDTYIIYFKLVLKCGRIAQSHLKIAQDHLKWTSKQPMHMGYPSYDSMDLGHTHGPSQVHIMMTHRHQYKILTVSKNR